MNTKLKLNSELSSTIQNRIIALLNRKNGRWSGSVSELNQAITTGLRRVVPTNWPKTPSILRRALNTVAPSLRRSGVKVQFVRETDHFRKRVVSFERQ